MILIMNFKFSEIRNLDVDICHICIAQSHDEIAFNESKVLNDAHSQINFVVLFTCDAMQSSELLRDSIGCRESEVLILQIPRN
ncbi:hypothetical protein ABKN59_005297 [Abortiporus biennis]